METMSISLFKTMPAVSLVSTDMAEVLHHKDSCRPSALVKRMCEEHH